MSMKITKIAFDISPLNNGDKVRGMGYYTKNLLEYLQKEIKNNPRYKHWKIDLITNSSQISLDYDLIHYPYFNLFNLTLPLRRNTPQIVTIPDLIPIQFSKHYPVGIRGNIKWQIQKFKVKKSDHIITISNYSKKIINKYLGYPENKISVTYLAANSNFRPIKDLKILDNIKAKYNLPKEFVLYVGDIDWNKNIPHLVKACTFLKYPLVIVGSAATNPNIIDHPWNRDVIWLQKMAKKYPQFLKLIGYIEDKELPLIYNLSKLYCQPSFAEGFGLPPVEAMQSGIPVVYSKESCLNEIMDNSGLMFDPYSVNSISKSIKKMWTDKKIQKTYINKGLSRAKKFNWQNTAKETLVVYEKILSNEH
jgi:glycosyltransferase involved in cell wall biosynthesis